MLTSNILIMDRTRRIAVFQSDGTSLYDQVDDNTLIGYSTSGQTLAADKLWPLIQVFVQFSREVHGGHVKRLVFRSPKAYAPAHKRFEPAPHPTRPAAVTIVYLAHSERFVVAVTERLIGDATTAANLLAIPNDARTPVFTVPELCQTIIDFLTREQAAVLAASATPPESTAHSGDGDATRHDSNTRSTSRRTSDSTSSRILMATSRQSNHTTSSIQTPPLVSIDPTKLSDFIKNSRNLLGR